EVHAVGEVLPRPGDALHVGLTTQPSLGADLAGDAGHLGGERPELVHHGVDGVLQLQDLAAHVDGDLLRQVTVGDGFGDVGGAAAVPSAQLGRSRVHAVGEVLPGPGDALHVGLAAEPPLRADLAGDACHLRGERPELVHHRVDGVLQLQDLAAHVDGDLLRQVAVGDGRRDVGDVADLAGQVGRHRVDAVGAAFPGASDALPLRLAAALPLGAALAGDAGHLGGEGGELIHHRVDGVLELEDLALHVHGDLLREITVRHRGGDGGDVAHLAGQVRRHR